MRRSTVLMFGSLLAATTVSAQVPTTSKGTKTESSSPAPSNPPSPSGKSSGGTISGGSSSGSSMSSPNFDRISTTSKSRVDRTGNWNYDPRSGSDYTRVSSKGFDRQQEERAKEFRNLRDSQITRDMIDRIRFEILSKQPKSDDNTVVPTTNKLSVQKSGTADDPNPPETPPSPNKVPKVVNPPINPPGTTVVINRYINDYYYWSRLNNSYFGYCSEFDRAWSQPSGRFGLRPFSIYGFQHYYWGDEFYSFMNRSYSPYGFGLYAGMGMYSPLYSSMYGSMFGGGYGGGLGGCNSYYGSYSDGRLRYDRPNHIDRCALVTVETFGEALYELQVSLPELKVNSAEELEKFLNARLEKNEAIFLTDEDGYELQLTPGTAKRFRVKHCERD